jgi:sulfate permease, SulP family
LFMKRIADFTNLHVSTHEKPDRAHGKLPRGTMIYRIEGPLFFGSINKTLEGADYIAEDVKKLILDLTQVPLIDMTGMMGVKTFLMSAAQDDRDIYICGERRVISKIREKVAGEPFARHVRFLPRVAEALEA